MEVAAAEEVEAEGRGSSAGHFSIPKTLLEFCQTSTSIHPETGKGWLKSGDFNHHERTFCFEQRKAKIFFKCS